MKANSTILRVLIFTFLFITILTPGELSGQEDNQDLYNKWAALVSFSPIATFSYIQTNDEYLEYPPVEGSKYIFPYGFNIEISRQLNKRITLISGVNFKLKPGKDLKNIPLRRNVFSQVMKSTDVRQIVELPVGIKFNLIAKPGIIDPYVKTGLRGSCYKCRYFEEFIIENGPVIGHGKIIYEEVKFFIFHEIGAGSYLHFSESTAFVIGSNLTFTVFGYGYLEILTGFSYSF